MLRVDAVARVQSVGDGVGGARGERRDPAGDRQPFECRLEQAPPEPSPLPLWQHEQAGAVGERAPDEAGAEADRPFAVAREPEPGAIRLDDVAQRRRGVTFGRRERRTPLPRQQVAEGGGDDPGGGFGRVAAGVFLHVLGAPEHQAFSGVAILAASGSAHATSRR